MITQSPFIISWLVVFVILGAGWYVIDRSIGVHLYRWWYDMTHRDPLSAEVERGFIFQQKAKRRTAAAVLLSVAQSISALIGGHSELALELLTFFIEVPMILLGFFVGPYIYKIWERKDRLLDTVDRIESGEVNLREELREASEKARGAMREVLSGGDTEAETSTAELAPPVVAPGPAVQPEELADPHKLMERYLRRGGDDEPGRS